MYNSLNTHSNISVPAVTLPLLHKADDQDDDQS